MGILPILMGVSLLLHSAAPILATSPVLAAPGGAAVLPAPDPVRMRSDLERLCGSDLAGRRTGSPGAERAAAYLADRMRALGLDALKPGGMGGDTPYHHPWKESGWPRGGAGAWGAAGAGGASGSNVVGVLPGGDPRLRSEFVFVTAHFDHLGSSWGTPYPGADDNASGTVVLMDLMRMLRHAGPRRSIAFLAVSGEEEGLLGSEAFLADPPVPGLDIVAEINMDMVGRGAPGQLHLMPSALEGAVSTLVQGAREAASARGLTLSAGIDAFWRRSDHHSFARRRIPSVCFFTGMHEDYHQPTDTPDKVDDAKLTAVAAILGDLLLRTANADARPAVLPPEVWKSWTWGSFDSGADLRRGPGFAEAAGF